jgi:predicted nucleic acid-binding Zn ribbon protein
MQPRALAEALRAVRAEVAPATLLGAVQEAWPEVVGETVAAEGQPVSERDGVITVACRSATWAQELDLMQQELVERLRERLGEGLPTPLRGLRFTADAARRL